MAVMDEMELGTDVCVPLKMNHKHAGIPKHLTRNVDLCSAHFFLSHLLNSQLPNSGA